MYKSLIILTIAVVAMGSALSLSIDYGVRKSRECNRLQNNQQSLLENIHSYSVRDSLNAVSVRVLTMKNDEFRDNFASLNVMIRDMGLKLKHVQSLSESAIESRYELQTPIKDTIIERNQQPFTAQKISYHDPYLSLNGLVCDGQFRGDIHSRDSLIQVVHKIPRKFLFLRWGTKHLKQEIISTNPHTQITYNRYIKLE